MAEYFNQMGVGINEVAIFKFFHQFNGDTDTISELVCHIEQIPQMIEVLQSTYSQYQKSIADAKKKLETNKSLS